MRIFPLRVFGLLIVCVAFLAAFWLLLNWGIPYFGSSTTNDVSKLKDVFVVFAEALALVVLLFMLSRFIRYLPRSHQFVIEAIHEIPGESPDANSSLLVTSEQKPLDLSELARERLEHELQGLRDAFNNYAYSALGARSPRLCGPKNDVVPEKGGPFGAHSTVMQVSSVLQQAAVAALHAILRERVQPPNNYQDGGENDIVIQASEANAADTADTKDKGCTPFELQQEYVDLHDPTRAPLRSIRQCIPTFGSPRHLHGLPQAFVMDVKDRSEVYRAITSRHAQELLTSAIQFAPDTYASVGKILQAIIPPHVTYITGHLQYDGHEQARIGITYEFTSVRQQRESGRRTVWRPVDTKASPKEDIALSAQYIALLEPAVRWLALMIWEYQMTAHARHILRPQVRRHYQAEVLYFFGALYRTSVEDFPRDEDFFCTMAVDHLMAAIGQEPEWFLPYVLLGSIYRRKAQKLREDAKVATQQQAAQKVQTRHKTQQALREATAQEAAHCDQEVAVVDVVDKDVQRLFDTAYRLAKDEEHDVRNRIRSYKAKAHLLSHHAAEADAILVELQQQYPADFDADRESTASYLYSLASCFSLASRSDIGRTWLERDYLRKESLRYLIYALVCNCDHYLWKDAETDQDLENLRQYVTVYRSVPEFERMLTEKVLENGRELVYPGPWQYGYKWQADSTANPNVKEDPDLRALYSQFDKDRRRFIDAMENIISGVIVEVEAAAKERQWRIMA